MASVWVTNPAGIQQFLDHNTILDSTLRAYARQAVAYAKRIAPVGEAAQDEQAGMYRDSIQAVKIDRGPGWRVEATDQKAHWIEYGAQHMRRHSVLTRAVATISGSDVGSFG